MSTNQMKKPEQLYENEMHKLNTELQIALLKWKVQSMKKPSFEF
ncbi:hypothetical protein [Nitrosopumilus sp. S4]